MASLEKRVSLPVQRHIQLSRHVGRVTYWIIGGRNTCAAGWAAKRVVQVPIVEADVVAGCIRRIDDAVLGRGPSCELTELRHAGYAEGSSGDNDEVGELHGGDQGCGVGAVKSRCCVVCKETGATGRTRKGLSD